VNKYRWKPLVPGAARLLALLLLFLSGHAAPGDSHERERAQMIEEIRETAMLAQAPGTGGVIDDRVLNALARVPRHRFVPDSEAGRAYENRPLPIGHGQTISQPYIVALMTDLLDATPGDRVFELGTGSGYQSAVLAEMGCDVWTMEVVEELGRRAAETLAATGYADRVRTRIGDAYYGWPEAAPFDAIVVTAAGDHVPPPLVEQLKPGGRMVIPVGTGFLTQQLLLVEKLEDGGVRSREVLPVRFVPLTGGH
jgi:protein-L-isoaspartate(D-aspartate) O-methyltransferase